MTSRFSRARLAAATLPIAIGALVLAGCASVGWPGERDAAQPSVPATAGATPTEAATAAPRAPSTPPADEVPAVQAETCDWDVPALSAAATGVPTGQSGALDKIIIGSWQHTHYDTGAGYEATDNDIRYVFPAAERILYCQHVPGITDHAENAADISWDGTTIVLPGGRAGFTVTAWEADTMVWRNELDGSNYLLQRR